MKIEKEINLEDMEDIAFYESGLSADGCLNQLDDYARKAITRYGRILHQLIQKDQNYVQINETTQQIKN